MSVGCTLCGELAEGYFGVDSGPSWPYCTSHMPVYDATVLPVAAESDTDLGESETDNEQDNGNGEGFEPGA